MIKQYPMIQLYFVNTIYGKTDIFFFAVINEKSRVRFNDVGDPCIVPYDGTPFIILARCERHCIFGKDKHKKKKNELKEGRDSCLKVNVHVYSYFNI